ncbi:MAG: amidohydrolase [Acidimicrobiales bacterium]|nr:amidohydrolase [Acidimicrobiales bacterium]
MHPVISADGHVDLPVLPADLFETFGDPALASRLPRVVTGDDGVGRWVDEHGVELARVGGSGNTGQPYVAGQAERLDRMNESGFWDDCANGVFHPSDPRLRIEAQDRDGIVGEVVYGILGMANAIDDPVVGTAMMRAYNNWLVEFCAAHPDRLVGVACLPSGAPDLAAAELRRCVDMGLNAVEIALTHDLLPLWRQEFAGLWAAAAEAGAIVHLHTIGPPVDTSAATSPREVKSWMGSWLTVFQLRMVERLAELVFGGILHAHPGLRVVLGESGIGWLPYVLDRMDLQYRERFRQLELDLLPSEYWRRQMAATFQLDEPGLLLAERIGVHTLMWGNDFPHGDGVWPDSMAVLDAQFASVDPAVRRAVTFENAARLYGFPMA